MLYLHQVSHHVVCMYHLGGGGGGGVLEYSRTGIVVIDSHTQALTVAFAGAAAATVPVALLILSVAVGLVAATVPFAACRKSKRQSPLNITT